jgi:predicted nucleic acid-binding protein
VLVDTSALIDYFAGTRCRESDLLDLVLSEGPAPATAGIVVQEFMQGFRARDIDVARRALADFVRLDPPSYRTHEAAADLHRRARRRGLTASTVDTLIVQLAAEQELLLLTRHRVQAALAGVAGVRLA